MWLEGDAGVHRGGAWGQGDQFGFYPSGHEQPGWEPENMEDCQVLVTLQIPTQGAMNQPQQR